jgi:hypothetical protein
VREDYSNKEHIKKKCKHPDIAVQGTEENEMELKKNTKN